MRNWRIGLAPCACGVQDCKTRRLRREQSRWLCRSHGTLQNAAARATWRRGLQESLHHIAQHGRRETVWCNTAVAQHREADQTPAPLQVISARLCCKNMCCVCLLVRLGMHEATWHFEFSGTHPRDPLGQRTRGQHHNVTLTTTQKSRARRHWKKPVGRPWGRRDGPRGGMVPGCFFQD